jgi:hypothetical protein
VVYAKGRLPGRWLNRPLLYINPERAVVTCLKPVDDPRSTGLLVRVWETAGLSAPMRLVIPEARRAMPTDLLERPRGPFHPVRSGMELFPRPHGFMAVQWER